MTKLMMLLTTSIALTAGIAVPIETHADFVVNSSATFETFGGFVEFSSPGNTSVRFVTDPLTTQTSASPGSTGSASAFFSEITLISADPGGNSILASLRDFTVGTQDGIPDQVTNPAFDMTFPVSAGSSIFVISTITAGASAQVAGNFDSAFASAIQSLAPGGFSGIFNEGPDELILTAQGFTNLHVDVLGENPPTAFGHALSRFGQNVGGGMIETTDLPMMSSIVVPPNTFVAQLSGGESLQLNASYEVQASAGIVPEPSSSVILMLFGGTGFLFARRRSSSMNRKRINSWY